MESHNKNVKLYDAGIDLARVYGMFCVVYAHCYTHGFLAGTPAIVSSVYVNQLFMFLSGLFYHRENDDAPFRYILRKYAQAYLFPYFFWNVIYGLLCTLLNSLGLLCFGAEINLYTLLLQPWGNSDQFMLNISAWFLLTLFLVSVVNLLLRKLLLFFVLQRVRVERILIVLYFCISMATIWRLDSQSISGTFSGISRMLILLPYYQLGISFQRLHEKLHMRQRLTVGVVAALIALGTQYINGSAFSCKMLYCYFGGNALLITVAATCCVICITELFSIMGHYITGWRWIRYISRSTKYIMLHHIFVIYLLQLGFFCLNFVGLLPEFDANAFRNSLWYRFDFNISALRFPMVIIAMIVPTVLHEAVGIIYPKFKRKI